MNIKDINRQIQGGRIYVQAFPGAKSTHTSYMLALTIS